MGQTTVSANLDNEVLTVGYRRVLVPGENTQTVPLSLVLTKESTSNFGTPSVVSLVGTVSIQASALEVQGPIQSVSIKLINPRYRSNLFISISETRDGLPVVTKVPVLVATDSVITPNNPVRDESELLAQQTDEFLGTYRPQVQLENDPGLPDRFNDVTPEPSLESTIYDLSQDDLVYNQMSGKVQVLSDGSLDLIEEDDYFVENGSFNLLPNPGFAEPLGWALSAPGLAVSLLPHTTNFPAVRRLTMSVASPNPFSAMDTAMLSTPTLIDLPAGQPYLAFSISLKLTAVGTQKFKVTASFFDAADSPLTELSDTIELSGTKTYIEFHSFFDVPVLASKVSLRFGPIDINNKFVLDLLWPQLEPSAVSTSRVWPIGSTRLLDIVRTSRPVEFGAPIYVSLTTIFRESPYILGLLDTTTSLLSGIQWAVSGNVLTFIVYDSNGDATYVTSDPFVAGEGDEAKFAFWLTSSDIEFYLDDALISSHSLPYTLPSVNKTILVGNVHQANQTIQSEVLDFRMAKVKPV